MEIKSISSNNDSFRGIKLSYSDFNSTKNVVNYLEKYGLNCVGKKTYKTNNSFIDIQKKTLYIRKHYKFAKDNFGVVFFPWSGEAYILSEPVYEQSIFKLVNKIDPNAIVNLLI